MPEIARSEELEAQAPAIENPESQLEATFWDLEGFEDFRDVTLPSLPDDLQAQLRSVLAASSHKADLRLDLDRFEGDGFPVDEYSARVLVERYPVEDAVSTEIADNADKQADKTVTQTAVSAETSENSEKQAEAFQNIAALRGALSGIGIHLNAELQAAGIDPKAPGGAEAFLRFLDQNAERYLVAARTRSPWSFVQIYETMEPFGAQSPDLTALLQRYETDYLLAQDYLTNPDRDLGDIENAKMALWDSAITEIDGDIVRGEGGEKLDMSGDQMQLSLEGAGGLELDVATIERPYTRENRLDILRKEQEIAQKEAEITALEAKSEKYQEIASNLRLENPATFDSEDAQARLVRQLLRSFPERHALSPLAEATDTGAQFLRTLTGFFEGEAEQADQLVTVRRAEIATFRQDIGKLQAQMDAKRRLAAEKIRDQKERVRATQAFYERLGVSHLIARLETVLARISPRSPLVLQDGTSVSEVNLSTLRISSSRTPGEGGPDDFRTQEVFVEIMNMALGGSADEPMSFGKRGMLSYRQNGAIIDRAAFDTQLARETGDLTFQTKAIARLFGARKEQP